MIAIAWAVAAGAVDAVGVSRLVEGEQAWIEAGGYVVVVVGAQMGGSTNPISAPACDALSRIDGVNASFGIREPVQDASIAYLQGGWASVYNVSPGIWRFLGASPAANPVVIATPGFADKNGIRTGETVSLRSRSRVDDTLGESSPLDLWVLNTQSLGEQFDGALLVPSLMTSTVDLCFVRTDAGHVSAVLDLLPAYLSYEGTPAVATRRLFSSDFTVDYAAAYQERPLQYLWVAAAVSMASVWALAQWFRRSETAIYATFGVSPLARVAMQVAEWGSLAVPGVLWGWAIGITGALAFGSRADEALALVSRHAALTLSTSTTLVILFALRPTGTLLNALKDR